MLQAFAWWSFMQPGIEAHEIIRRAADIGYDGVELVPQQYWQLVKDAVLTIVSIVGHESIDAGFNRREHHPRIEQEIFANLALAQRWSIPNLIVFSGNRAGLDDVKGAEITAEGLSRVAKVAESMGVTLLLELLNSKVDHPDYQADHSTWGASVITMVNSPAVKLLYDIYHMQIMEGDLIRTIRQHSPHIGHYHTAGNPGRHDLDETQEIYYPPIVRAIQDTGYQGFITHEFIPRADPYHALQQTFDLLKRSVEA